MSDETILIQPGDPRRSRAESTVRLRVTKGPHAGASWTFAQDATIMLGRQDPSQLKLPLEKAFSREHLCLQIAPPRVQLTDNDSSNGTWVNGVRLVAASLVDGDRFGVGETEIVCEVLGAEQVPSQSEPDTTDANAAIDDSAERTRDHSAPKTSAVDFPVSQRQSAQSSILQTRIAECETQPSRWRDENSPQQAEANVLAMGVYLLKRPLTRDRKSTLYMAKDHRTQKPYLIKVFHASVANSDEAKQAFFREAAVLTSLDHPRILKTLEFGIEDDKPFLVMESVDPLDLLATIDGQSPERRILTATWTVSRLLQAIHCAHQHEIVHRRIHPSSIFGYREGRHLQIKLGNFEPAIQDKNDDPSSMTHDRSATATQSYLAPEQLQDASAANPAVDLFACGCCLFRFATGEEPDMVFQPEKTHVVLDVATYLPKTLRDVIRQSIDVDPARRFPSAESFAEAIFPFHQRV
ncbi:protein kinase domain-containing protein [Novipirellula sp. SH528]|uniref:protein kinase domain-containing protein n=1 Tax=Novipirellula sp. SH528 TaxID=3454466 RepID=UPI003F9FCF98